MAGVLKSVIRSLPHLEIHKILIKLCMHMPVYLNVRSSVLPAHKHHKYSIIAKLLAISLEGASLLAYTFLARIKELNVSHLENKASNNLQYVQKHTTQY